MKRKENIFEELGKMRNLIKSKPGTVISEQEIIKEFVPGASFMQQQQQQGQVKNSLTGQVESGPLTGANYFNSNFKPYDFGQNSGMLVDCAKVYQFTIDMPSAQMQQDFAKKSGLNPKSPVNFPYFCSGTQMAVKLGQLQSQGVQKTKAPASNYSQSVGNYARGVQKAIGTQETGKISSADLDKIIAMLGGEEATDKSVQLPKRADGQIDLDKVIADLEK